MFRKFIEPKGRIIFKMDCDVSDSMFVIPMFVIYRFFCSVGIISANNHQHHDSTVLLLP